MIGRSAAPRILAAAARLVVDRSGGTATALGQRDLGALGPGVERAFQRHRPRPARGRCQIACETRGRRLLRAADALGPFGDVAHQAQLVVDLVQMAVAPVDVGLRDLADQADHRRVHAVGGEQRGAGIQQAGAGTTAKACGLPVASAAPSAM